MVEISEVVDRKMLEAYLGAQAPEVAQAIAARCAMRVWPLLVHGLQWEESPARLIFSGHRAILISGVASICPTPEIRKSLAARAAAFAAANAFLEFR